MKTLSRFDSVIPSDINNACKVVTEVGEYLTDCCGNLDESTMFEIKVILNELVLNAVRHGNRSDINKKVRIAAGVTGDGRAYFIVEDEGDGFDYTCLLQKPCWQDCDDLCEIKETGRGILIVKNLCDRIRYGSSGRKVVVVKKVQ